MQTVLLSGCEAAETSTAPLNISADVRVDDKTAAGAVNAAFTAPAASSGRGTTPASSATLLSLASNSTASSQDPRCGVRGKSEKSEKSMAVTENESLTWTTRADFFLFF